MMKQRAGYADGYVEIGGDCDDSRADTFPDANEICDDRDNNCDGDIDEGLFEFTMRTTMVWLE